MPYGIRLGFMVLPAYRLWVVAFSLVICVGTWLAIEHTRLGAYLRAASERPHMVEAFGINVPRMITLTYGFGVGLAALSGVLAAPIYQVSPSMGSSALIVVFAVVVIGGMGSIAGAIASGYALGVVEGLTKAFYPSAANVVIFLFMILALFLRPSGLFASRDEVR
jgi:branched-chain amino acid transport system permease protein